MRSIYFSLALLIVTIPSGLLAFIPHAQAEVFSPDECAAVLGTCTRAFFFGSNCSGDETEVAKCNVGVKSCCKIVKDSSGTVLSGAAAIAEFNRDMSSGSYTEALEAAPVKAGAGLAASGPPDDSATSAGTGGAAAIANLNYTLLEKIPGQESATGDLPGYVQAILNATMMIIVLSAVFMISVGGFLYLTSAGNTSRAGQARGIITDAIYGLVLALIAYFILYVINPDLVTLRISSLATTASPTTPIPASASPTGVAVPATSTSSGDTYTHADAVAALSAKGIMTTSSGSCSDPKRKECTSLEGIPKSTIANVIALKEKSGCSFNVTGGTETGHKSHGAGRPIVDVSEAPCLENKFRTQKSSLGSEYNIQSICADSNSREAAYGCSYVEPAPHFHIQFSS